MSEWDLQVGDELTRDERRQRFGGGLYGGIEASRTTPNVFLYTDPQVGAAHGYGFDGWVGGNRVFQYTGEGQEGDQRLIRGNRALLDHRDGERALRIFAANGIKAGTKKTKRQLYIGEFEIDDADPYFQDAAPDKNEDWRMVHIFRLRPVGTPLVRDEEQCSNTAPPLTPQVSEVEVQTSVKDVEVEKQHVFDFERKAMNSTKGERREAALQIRYMKHLKAQGHVVGSRKIDLPGATHPLTVDLYDATAEELVEVKSSAVRGHIRYAIGQIFDYSRYVQHKSLSVLLPARPAKELVDLLTGLGISCVFETQLNTFERIDP